MFSNDDLLQYLNLGGGGSGAAPPPLDLGAALGVTPQAGPVAMPTMPQAPAPATPPPLPVGATPGFDVGSLTGPGPAPSLAPPPVARPQAPAPTGRVTPQSIAALRDQAYNQQTAGIDAMAAAKGEQARIGGQGELVAAQEMAKRQQDDAAITAAANKDAADRTAALRKDVDDLGNAKVDPNHLVDNMSTFQKIMGVIALGLGGAYSARSGKANPALEMIQGQINRDIQAQMANIETRKAGISAKGTLLQQEIAQGRDAAEARTKATAALYDTAIRETNAQVKMLGTDTAKAEGMQLTGQLADAKEKEIAAFHQQEVQNGIAGGHLALAQKQEKFSEGMQVGQFQRQLNEDITNAPGKAAETSLKQAEAYKAMHPDAKAAAAVDPTVIHAVTNDANGIVRAPPEAAKEINKQVGLVEPLINDIDKLTKLNKSISGSGSLVPDALVGQDTLNKRQAARALWINIANNLSVAQGQGQVKEGEWGVVEKQLGDPDGWRAATSKLNTIRESMVNRVNKDIEDRTGAKLKTRWDPKIIEELPGRTNAAPLPPDEEDRRRAIVMGQGTGGSPTAPLWQNVQAASMADVTRRLQAQQAAAQQQQAAETGANADYLKYLGLQ